MTDTVDCSSYSLHKDGNGIDIDNWTIKVTQGPILSTKEMEEWQLSLQLRLPTMVFGHNQPSFLWKGKHRSSFHFSAYDALKTVSHEEPTLKVKPADLWKEKKNTFNLVVPSYDWTYTTCYGGTWDRHGEEEQLLGEASYLDWSLLKREDISILFFRESVLFEDELDDQGISVLSVRLRVMSSFFYVLCRFWLRVDKVYFKICDTRIFHQLGTRRILREAVQQEATFEQVVEMGVDNRHFTSSDDMQKVLPVTKRCSTVYHLQ
eukprot:jgi/Galph1/799/GphlegSOOS_G5549.1